MTASDGMADRMPAPSEGLQHDQPLKVTIVGAGIGGLCAAIGLRQNGHQVDLYDQSRLVNEQGAAVHLAPNANGVLRHWGIYAEVFGAISTDFVTNMNDRGSVLQDLDVREPNKRWQHPWHLVHRVNLHEYLKKVATGLKGPGPPARLHHASKVIEVNPEAGEIVLENRTRVSADVVIGADGIYSRTRKYIKDAKLFGSGKAAFRFLIPKETLLANPDTAALVQRNNSLVLWFGSDRRVVMYPCHNNEILNFVCIHPDTESHATSGDEWNRQGSVEQLLKVYESFDPRLKAMMRAVDPAVLKVWQLLDMEQLPTWCAGRMALLGDAAHPFTPHQGQGASQAIEDAAALSVVLPKGTAPAAVSERLRLYERIRYERAHTIQEFSRQAGKDWINGKAQIDMMKYTSYNFGHNELEHSAEILKNWG